MVANFLARAVVDEVLPPAFLSEQNNKRPGDIVIEKSISLLSREHCTARLERVWGPGDGRPVSELKIEMDQMLQEYLLSRELDECARCVKELDSAHYMHELVKRGVKIAMEGDGKDSATQHEKSAIDAMAALFGFLVKNAIISEHQVSKGVDRLHRILDDLKLDVPAAPTLLKDFEEILKEEIPSVVEAGVEAEVEAETETTEWENSPVLYSPFTIEEISLQNLLFQDVKAASIIHSKHKLLNSTFSTVPWYLCSIQKWVIFSDAIVLEIFGFIRIVTLVSV